MERFTDLSLLLHTIWQDIQQGVEHASHPYHTPAFGSVGADGPSLRTVILRSVEVETRSLLLHSDRRAQKIQEVQANPRVSWLFWHPEHNQQLRLSGTATVHFDDAIADQLWHNSHPRSLKLYVKPRPPGTLVDTPQSGLPDPIQTEDLSDLAQVASGRSNFAVIRTQIDAIDFLHLRRDGNYRARFTWQGDQLSSNWLIP